MIPACRQFLSARLAELTLPDGYSRPFVAVEPGRTIFFGDMPRDFLKDNDYAANCLPLIDRSRRFGRLTGRTRDLVARTITLQRRKYSREILFRCLLFGPADELYGTSDRDGLMDRLQQSVAGYRKISAIGDGSAIRIEPQDLVRPWDSETELGRKIDRPPLGIVRIQFVGGLQTASTIDLIPSVTINPQFE